MIAINFNIVESRVPGSLVSETRENSARFALCNYFKRAIVYPRLKHRQSIDIKCMTEMGRNRVKREICI